MNAIITEDAFKVSRDTLKSRYKTDRILAVQWRAVDRRMAVKDRGVKKIRQRITAFKLRQQKYLCKIYAKMAKRRLKIRQHERLKLMRAAAREFQARVRREEGLTAR